jgi:hypothetical protein
VAAVTLIGIVVVADRAGAQLAPAQPGYGTASTILQPIGYPEFTPSGDVPPSYSDQGYNRFSTTPLGVFAATPHLPAGAQIVSFRLDYCDDSTAPGEDVQALILECPGTFGVCTLIAGISSGTGPPGCSSVAPVFGNTPWFVDNATKRYLVQVVTQSGNISNRFTGVTVGYRLRVSPPPPVATFLDVPASHPFFPFVEALTAAGITGGCDLDLFCPDAPLTRGQMAVFLAVALGLHFPN